jgi:hypothetical protein
MSEKHKTAKYPFAYTMDQLPLQQMGHHACYVPDNGPPAWAAYLTPKEWEETEPQQLVDFTNIGYWRQTGVSHLTPFGTLVLQWRWYYR